MAALLRHGARTAARAIVLAAAILYFLIDGVFLALLRPVARWIAARPWLARLSQRIAASPPYVALALFLVPVAVLEPAKPVGLYLIGTGEAWLGIAVIVGAEILKLLVVERLFRLVRPQLLRIGLFARIYGYVLRWLDYLTALPPWQAVLRVTARVKAAARRLIAALRPR